MLCFVVAIYLIKNKDNTPKEDDPEGYQQAAPDTARADKNENQGTLPSKALMIADK